jgi:exodeoxyribonuclease V beta subunit
MKTLEPFDLTKTEFKPGVTLIEASAGTGKTFTIAGIVLRLVLELRIPIEQILAMTYTVAATEELRERVRTRLRDALDDLRSGSLENEIVASYLKHNRFEQGIRDLDLAVQNFDNARIFTIHGFCQRTLGDRAFESGLLFDMELLPDPTLIFEEVAHDFWRKQFYRGPALLSRLAIADERSPAAWTARLQRTINHPDLTVIPPPDPEPAGEIGEQIEKKFVEIAKEWGKNAASIGRLLREDTHLSRAKSKNFPLYRIPQIEADLAAVCSDFQQCDPMCLRTLTLLSKSEIERCTKPTGQAPRHPFFDLCEDFCDLTSRFFHRLDHEFMLFVGQEIPRRKSRLNVLTYDDLLTHLRDAIKGQPEDTLAKTLRAQYRAVLIDEFQDTDPVQYEIFSHLFSEGDHYLFFIGDPKQAIYGFRGADVFTYLRAASQASLRYTLETNFRAEKSLLDGINALFSNVERPFSVEGIEYRPVRPSQKPREGFAELVETTLEGPLRFRLLSEVDGPFNQDTAEAEISRAVVADIARLKNSGAQLAGLPLTFGHMAVLVRSNAQAANLQKLLRAAGIRSVLKTEESVFKTDEASEILRLLKAVLEPKRDVLLRTALSTRLVGLNSAEIMALDSSEEDWQGWLEKFLEYSRMWENQCFIALFRHLFVDQKVRQRLVKHPGGERSLTNFLHLAELLHGAESKRRLTPDALCAWLRQQISDSGKAADEDQLRLESDDDAVLLATVHKSKGLEYPVVFCPFLWKGGGATSSSEIFFHDPEANYRLTLDLRKERPSPDDNELRAREENRAEALRLLYVALTRAQNRCYVYAGAISGFETSPLGHLLANAQALPALQALGQRAGGAIAVSLIDLGADRSVKVKPPPLDSSPMSARPYSGSISKSQMIASFTGLTSERAIEDPDRDGVEPRQPMEEEIGDLNGLAGFQRGIRAGLFLHDLLEDLDFQTTDPIEELVRVKLAVHGIPGEGWHEALSNQVRRMLVTPLAPSLTLNRVPLADRLSEVEFSYPILPLQSRQLRKLFVEHGGNALPAEFPKSLGRLDFRPVEGFIRGFIDLLFRFEGRYYLIDWKSNWLGHLASDYDQIGVRECMVQHSYFLQYYLYTLAADLYLSRRVPGYEYDKQFGGVFYLFFRGVDPEVPGRAIFHDRPQAALVRTLRQRLMGISS